MKGLLLNLLSNAIWFLGGLFAIRLFIIFRVKLPTQQLWQIADPDKLTIVAAASTQTHTGDYVRPATGIGQVRALALILKSLNKGYRGINIKNIYLSSDSLQERLENDLLILGGPKNNNLAKKFLKEIESLQPLNQIGNNIIRRNDLSQPQNDSSSHTVFCGETDKHKVLTDYGIIIRTKNPFSQDDKIIILFSGSHTYGTMAAAKYFTELLRKDIGKRRTKLPNMSALISTKVVDDYPVSIKLENIYTW